MSALSRNSSEDISAQERRLRQAARGARSSCNRCFFLDLRPDRAADSCLRYNAYVIVLAIDTCDSRGSVALLRDDVVLGLMPHETKDEYSSWLLLAVTKVLKEAGLRMPGVDGYAVAAGPGSFTGVRVGLTTVKAWAEVYGRPVAAVSRLEGVAAQAAGPADYVAAFVNAQRGQVFGAVYRKDGDFLAVGEEMVMAPGKFVEAVAELTNGKRTSWVSPDAALVEAEPAWKERGKQGENIERASATLAGIIGRIGLRRLQSGKMTDALGLDANYVRRSDAEIFWKGAAHGH
jgi:tRNA threonylcarbamoyladenosine biosynthesis protein TsaB